MAKTNIKAIEKRIAEDKAKILVELEESGNVSFACKRIGITRKTFYRWKEDDRTFSFDAGTAIELGKSFVNDLAHTQLIRKMQEGNMQAIRFQLVSCHQDYQTKGSRKIDEPIDVPVGGFIIDVIDPQGKIVNEKPEEKSQGPTDEATNPEDIITEDFSSE